MSVSKTAVSLQQCAKTFGDDSTALYPLNLEISGGETVVLLGPSGCGKTTLLRIIAGLESPDQGGRVLFNGDDVTRIPIEKRNVGMIFQSYALFPNMDVFDNIAYGLRVRREDRSVINDRVGEMLEMMQISDLSHRKIDQLSGGQRQRVAIARAIATRPRVLLLDEPLAALDALLRDRLRVEIDSLLRTLGITAVYVTHDQAEAMALGDRIVVMSKGRIAQSGTPREIYYNPTDPFVADFIGTLNRVSAASVKGYQGSTPELFFRPEDAEIVSADSGNYSGHVKSAFFLGDRTRLVIAGHDQAEVVVDSKHRAEFAIGTEVHLQMNLDRLIDMSGCEGGQSAC